MNLMAPVGNTRDELQRKETTGILRYASSKRTGVANELRWRRDDGKQEMQDGSRENSKDANAEGGN